MSWSENSSAPHQEQQYLDLMRKILNEGVEREDRTGVGTKSIFGAQMRFDLSRSFPLFTTKKVWFKGIVHELLWLLSGSTNIKYLVDNGVHIWDEWADKNGDLGPVYGAQWRSWMKMNRQNHDGLDEPIDQVASVIKSIKTKPYDRGHIVSAWNVADLDKMALRPCHTMFQFYVADGKLSCQLYQRSGDWLVGIPFNVASYSLLCLMIAQVCDLKPGEFIHSIGDAHIYLYKDHLDGAAEQLGREPFLFPTVQLNPDVKAIDDFKFDDIKLIGYQSHDAIKMTVAI